MINNNPGRDTNANPLYPPLDALFKRVIFLNAILFHIQSQLDNFQELFRARLNEADIGMDKMGAFKALNIRDITEHLPDGFQNRYPAGGYASRGEGYLLIMNVILSRNSALTVSQAFEAFETFLLDVLAAYLHSNRECADQKKLSRFQRKSKSFSLNPTHIEYWKQFVRFIHHNEKVSPLEYVRQLVPEFRSAERNNNLQINLDEWLDVLTEARHAITHSNMIIKPGNMRGWSRIKQNILKHFFPGEDTGLGYDLTFGRNSRNSKFEITGISPNNYGFPKWASNLGRQTCISGA